MDLWRIIFFALFVCGVFAQKLMDDRFGEFLLSCTDGLRPQSALTIPVWIALFLAASYFGMLFLPPFCFLFGVWLSECAAWLWSGACWAGSERAFALSAVICVPCFFLICLSGARLSCLAFETGRRAGGSWRKQAGLYELSFFLIGLIFLCLTQGLRLI